MPRWSTISQVAQAGTGDTYWDVGDTKDITFSSTITLDSGSTIAANSTWRAYIIGFNHNSSKEGTKRIHFCIGRTTDEMEICFYGRNMNSSNTNSGGWNSSAMKAWLNGTFYNSLPSDLKSVITNCTKYTDNTGNSSNAEANVTSTSQKIWIMSEFEVFGSITYANQYEQNSQAQYDYYKNGNGPTRDDHSTKKAQNWWLRSPKHDTVAHFCMVQWTGIATADPADYTRGVSPCFTIS